MEEEKIINDLEQYIINSIAKLFKEGSLDSAMQLQSHIGFMQQIFILRELIKFKKRGVQK